MLKQFDTWIASADKHVRRAALNTLAAAADQKLEVAGELINTPVPAVAGLSTEPAPGLAAGKDSGATHGAHTSVWKPQGHTKTQRWVGGRQNPRQATPRCASKPARWPSLFSVP